MEEKELNEAEKENNHKISYEEYDKDADRRLARKIAWLTIPLLCVLHAIEFINNFILNYSTVLGLYDDINITNAEFGLLASFSYVAMLVTQILNQYCFQMFPVAKYYGIMTVCWGASLGCSALASNFRQLAALRFLIGFFQGSNIVASMLIISIFFRRSEQTFWVTIMMISSAIGTAVSGLFGYAIGFMDGIAHMHAWKWLMIIFGICTGICGILVFIFLPDTPYSRWFRLTEDEKELIKLRIQDNGTVKTNKVNFAHVRESLKDIRFYCYGLSALFVGMSGACTVQFSSQFIQLMGFSNLSSLLLNIPIAVTSILLTILGLYLTQRFQQRYYTMIFLCLITILGILLLCILPEGPVELIGIFLSSITPEAVIAQAIVVSNVMGYTKRVFYLGTLYACSNIGSALGPIILGSASAQIRYYPALIAFMIFLGLASCATFGARQISVRENRKRQELERQGQLPAPPARREELDLTDGEDLHFRYYL